LNVIDFDNFRLINGKIYQIIRIILKINHTLNDQRQIIGH